MWTLMIVITSGPYIVRTDYSVPMSFYECQQAVKDAKIVNTLPPSAEKGTSVVIYCKKT